MTNFQTHYDNMQMNCCVLGHILLYQEAHALYCYLVGSFPVLSCDLQ